jgi:hypothetical protein
MKSEISNNSSGYVHLHCAFVLVVCLYLISASILAWPCRIHFINLVASSSYKL